MIGSAKLFMWAVALCNCGVAAQLFVESRKVHYIEWQLNLFLLSPVVHAVLLAITTLVIVWDNKRSTGFFFHSSPPSWTRNATLARGSALCRCHREEKLEVHGAKQAQN